MDEIHLRYEMKMRFQGPRMGYYDKKLGVWVTRGGVIMSVFTVSSTVFRIIMVSAPVKAVPEALGHKDLHSLS